MHVVLNASPNSRGVAIVKPNNPNNQNNFIVLQTARLWHAVTTNLATTIMFNDTPRVGVVQHLTLGEYERMNRKPGANVVWVLKHKLGDKRPATLVLDDELTDFMDR